MVFLPSGRQEPVSRIHLESLPCREALARSLVPPSVIGAKPPAAPPGSGDHISGLQTPIPAPLEGAVPWLRRPRGKETMMSRGAQCTSPPVPRVPTWMLENPQAPLAAPRRCLLPSFLAPSLGCPCPLAQGGVDARPSCAALRNHGLETPRRGIKPAWNSTAQRDAAELSNAARLASSLLENPPSLPCPLFPSLKKVGFF